jgi:hypothetical protein
MTPKKRTSGPPSGGGLVGVAVGVGVRVDVPVRVGVAV